MKSLLCEITAGSWLTVHRWHNVEPPSSKISFIRATDVHVHVIAAAALDDLSNLWRCNVNCADFLPREKPRRRCETRDGQHLKDRASTSEHLKLSKLKLSNLSAHSPSRTMICMTRIVETDLPSMTANDAPERPLATRKGSTLGSYRPPSFRITLRVGILKVLGDQINKIKLSIKTLNGAIQK